LKMVINARINPPMTPTNINPVALGSPNGRFHVYSAVVMRSNRDSAVLCTVPMMVIVLEAVEVNCLKVDALRAGFPERRLICWLILVFFYIDENFSCNTSQTLSFEILTCSMESRSLKVTVPFSVVSWSTVTPNGVPASSCLR